MGNVKTPIIVFLLVFRLFSHSELFDVFPFAQKLFWFELISFGSRMASAKAFMSFLNKFSSCSELSSLLHSFYTVAFVSGLFHTLFFPYNSVPSKYSL
jgi:hypothetical protein